MVFQGFRLLDFSLACDRLWVLIRASLRSGGSLLLLAKQEGASGCPRITVEKSPYHSSRAAKQFLRARLCCGLGRRIPWTGYDPTPVKDV